MPEPKRRSARILELIWKQRFASNSIAAHIFALVCVAAAVSINLIFAAPGIRIAPFATLFPAILISALAGGVLPGLTALVVGGVAAWFLFLPSGTLIVSFGAQITSIALYTVTGIILLVLVALMRRAAEHFDKRREQLHDDHERLVAALEASGAGTWRWNIQNDVVEWDDALCRLYGIARDDAPRNSQGFISIIHPDDRAYAGEVIQKCVEGGADVEYEFRAVVPKGTLWIYDRSKLVRDAGGRPAYMTGACLDVTERREASEERRRISTWLRMAMEVARIGTWEVNPATGMVTASDSMNAFFGFPAGRQSRPFADYLALVHPDDVAHVKQAVATRASSSEPVSVEYRLLAPNGDVRWLSSRGAFVRDEGGSGRVVGSLYEITDRKRIDEEREATLQQRELLLKELNHRVKNNLQMVSSLLNLQASRMDDPVAREHFRKAVDRVQAIGDIHARLYQGDHLGQIDFDQYLKDLCERLRDSIIDPKSVSLELDAKPIVLDLDRAIPLGLIVNELVTNAIKHAFPNGARGTVKVSLDGDDGGVRLLVCDSGPGRESTVNGEREGLGMRLVEGLMRQIGGTLKTSNDPGACYEISLPKAEHAA